MIMSLARFLILVFIIAALLPAGREMLDGLMRELSSTKHRPQRTSRRIRDGGVALPGETPVLSLHYMEGSIMQQFKRLSAFLGVALLATLLGCAATATREGTGEYVDD